MLEREIDIKSKQYKIYKNLVWNVYSRIKENGEIKRVNFSTISPIQQKYKFTTIKNESEPFLSGEYIFRIYDRILNKTWSNSKDNYKLRGSREDKWSVREYIFDYVEVFDTSLIRQVNSEIFYPEIEYQNYEDDDYEPIQPPPMLRITITDFPEFEPSSSATIISEIPYTINSIGIRYTYSGDNIEDMNSNLLERENFIKETVPMKIFGNSTISFYGRYKYYDLEYKGLLNEYEEDYVFPPIAFNIDIELEERII